MTEGPEKPKIIRYSMRQNKHSLSPAEKWTITNDFKLKQAGFRSHIKTVPVMHRLSVLK